MNAANPGRLDLNLVRVFLAIWELRSLTSAGERLNLTQPAISHALRRLREQFNDPLFVRSSHVMLPTEAAQRLHEPLSEALQILDRAVNEHAAFDPVQTRRIFRIAMSDVAESCYLPPLLTALEKAAPHAQIESIRLEASTIDSLLRSGSVDMAIGFLPELKESCVKRELFTDRFVCLVRSGHPIATRKLTRAAFSKLRFVYGGIGATGHQMIERWLDNSGIARQTALRIGHFTIAPEIVRQTDLAVIFPKSLAGRINRDGAFALLDLPFTVPTIQVEIHVHAHFQFDPGIRWLGDQLVGLGLGT